MGRTSELKRYRSILARRVPRDITDTLSVDPNEQNRVEDDISLFLKLRHELTGNLHFGRCGDHGHDRKLLSRLHEFFEFSSCLVHLRIDDLAESCDGELVRPVRVVDYPQGSDRQIIV